jgi:hypothetical protein
MFGDQQPDAGKVSADLIGQSLADTALDALRITRLALTVFPTDTNFELFALIPRTTLI